MLDQEIGRRSYGVTVDGQDDSSVRRLRIDEATSRLATATASAVRLSIGRAQVAYNTAADIAAVEEAACVERLKWLHVSGHVARAPLPVSKLQIAINLSAQS